MDKLNDVSRNELYTRASKHPQPIAQNSQSLLLDYEFCKLFKMLEGACVIQLFLQLLLEYREFIIFIINLYCYLKGDIEYFL